VYYTELPNLPLSQWRSQVVDNNQLTTISELTPHSIYTIRVQTLTNVGPGPLSPAVLVKTQQGGAHFYFPDVIHVEQILNPD